MAAPDNQLILIYNADSTILGKLSYGYRKLTASKSEDPPCAACSITNGPGLSLTETSQWTTTKQTLQEQGWQVIQDHRDEVETSVKDWIQEHSLRYPLLLARQNSQIELVADAQELAACGGDSTQLLSLLDKKHISTRSSSSQL